MEIFVDSREKKFNHIIKYFDQHGIKYSIIKLDVGDYCVSDNNKLVIDRKSGLEEIARNLLNKSDSARFWREIRRSHEQGVKLVVLIESGRTVKTINDVSHWKSQYSPVTGRRMLDEMIRLEFSYGVRWAFCDKRSTGRKIVEILTGQEQTRL